jgi:hypothetical protein
VSTNDDRLQQTDLFYRVREFRHAFFAYVCTRLLGIGHDHVHREFSDLA